MYPAGAVTVIQSEPPDYVSRAESGSDVHQLFCPDCGVYPISYNAGTPQFRAIKAEVLDVPSGFVSQGSLWTRSAQPWHRIPADEPQPCLADV